MNSLSFTLPSYKIGEYTHHDILPMVDSVPLTELVKAFETEHGYDPPGSYGGLTPFFYRYGAWDDYFHGYNRFGDGGKSALLVCRCGVYTCWPFLGKIQMNEDDVVWHQFEQPFRRERDYSGFGPFTFEWGEYQDALEDLLERTKDMP